MTQTLGLETMCCSAQDLAYRPAFDKGNGKSCEPYLLTDKIVGDTVRDQLVFQPFACGLLTLSMMHM